MGGSRGLKRSKGQHPSKSGHSGPKGKAPLSTDDFLAKGFETDSEEEEEDYSEDDTSNSDNDDEVSLTKHKQSLERLKKQDPEFYNFLKKEDSGLLELNSDDNEDDDDEDDNDENEDDDNEDDDDEDDEDEEFDGTTDRANRSGIHKLPKKLEIASDSDEEDGSSDDNEPKVKARKMKVTAVTLKMITLWSKSLRASSSLMAMQNTISAFKAAVQEARSERSDTCKYRVEGSGVFNGVIRLCLTDLLPAFNRFLNLKPSKNQKPVLPSSSPKWKKIRLLIKSYLTDTLQLLSHLGEPAILNTILKHASQLTTFYVCFPKLAKALLKKCISLWSSGDETTRVLAFIIINRITRMMQDRLLDFTLKQMYMAYVKNCKFTSPSLLPMINFMQRTLVEMFAIDMEKAYQYGFVYVRQLAIHLRNAITVKKKENCQAVYNWQYVHSLHFWARFLAELHKTKVVEPLLYPLTQVIIGTIKLVPTARYFPLRFHCVRMLNILCGATGVYIPVLPFLLEVFEMTDFNKHHKAVSFKPLNFAVILKLSKAQVQEKAFRDGLIDQLYELLLETFNVHGHTVGFPELVLPAVLQLKQFIKQCKVANYTKLMKQILEKVNTTVVVIRQRRKSAGFNISDTNAVEAWERKSKEEGTPLAKYYVSWRRMRDRELVHEIAGKERISTDDLPTINRERIPKKATTEERIEFADLFNTDSEDEDDETRFLPKNQRPKKKQKTEHDTDSSDYSDLDSDDLEKLAGSADEEDEEDEEEEEDECSDTTDSSDSNEAEDVSEDEAADRQMVAQDLSEGSQKDIVEDFVMSDDGE